MNRALARIQARNVLAYYRRVAREAAREATGRWFASFGSSGFVGLLTFVLLLVAGDGLTSALWGLLAFVAAWLLIVAWYLVTIPPRIEQATRSKEETLQVMSQRRGVGIELKNHMVALRMEARRAREAEIQANGQGGTIVPDAYHQRALLAAKDAAERLEWLGKQTGQSPYDHQALEITDAVTSKKCANAEEAIAQLEALADVFERQLVDGYYQ